MKYKVGDRVIVRPDLLLNRRYGSELFAEEMLPYEEVHIKKIIDDRYYLVKENIFNYTDEMLDGLVEEQNDMVNHPKHYTTGKIECIDYIKDKLTPEEFKGFVKGNVFKYLTREHNKNGNEDIFKAKWYLDCLCDELQK